MKSIKPTSIITIVKEYKNRVEPYAFFAFFLMLAGIYGFVIMRINTLSNRPVDENAISAEVQRTAAPNIDPKALSQLQSLNDNSVNVQVLFKQGRTNPFQE